MSAARLVFASRPIPFCTIPRFLAGTEAEAMQQRLSQRIGERARLLFEQSGNVSGHDDANWFRAESEILSGQFEIRESGTWLMVDAGLPNASGQHMEITVTPARIILCAREIATAASESPEQGGREIFFLSNLPLEVDPVSAAASFRDHQLHLMVKKAVK